MNAPRAMLVTLTVDELEELVERAVARALEARSTAPAGGPPAEWLDVAAAADLMGIHTRTVRRLAERGLKHLKVGRTYRFRRSDLLEWIEAQSVGGAGRADVLSGSSAGGSG
jgi:excisionase family DNA binding protein